LNRNVNLEGKITINLTIYQTGIVNTISIIAEDILDEKFISDIRTVYKKFNFGAAANDFSMSYSIEFVSK